MTTTIYEPGFVGPILYGYRCHNEAEWTATQLNSGDRCWFRKHRSAGCREEIGRWKAGTLLYTWLYDGVIAKVYEDDPDDYIEHSLFLDMGDELRSSPP